MLLLLSFVLHFSCCNTAKSWCTHGLPSSKILVCLFFLSFLSDQESQPFFFLTAGQTLDWSRSSSSPFQGNFLPSYVKKFSVFFITFVTADGRSAVEANVPTAVKWFKALKWTNPCWDLSLFYLSDLPVWYEPGLKPFNLPFLSLCILTEAGAQLAKPSQSTFLCLCFYASYSTAFIFHLPVRVIWSPAELEKCETEMSMWENMGDHQTKWRWKLLLTPPDHKDGVK